MALLRLRSQTFGDGEIVAEFLLFSFHHKAVHRRVAHGAALAMKKSCRSRRELPLRNHRASDVDVRQGVSQLLQADNSDESPAIGHVRVGQPQQTEQCVDLIQGRSKNKLKWGCVDGDFIEIYCPTKKRLWISFRGELCRRRSCKNGLQRHCCKVW